MRIRIISVIAFLLLQRRQLKKSLEHSGMTAILALQSGDAVGRSHQSNI